MHCLSYPELQIVMLIKILKSCAASGSVVAHHNDIVKKGEEELQILGFQQKMMSPCPTAETELSKKVCNSICFNAASVDVCDFLKQPFIAGNFFFERLIA